MTYTLATRISLGIATDRPFASVEEMDSHIINAWNATVSNKDTVYFLGDFAFASRERIVKIIKLLNFKQMFIVPGNHDEKIMEMWNHPISPSPLPSNVKVLNEIVRLKKDGQRWLFCHYPIESWDDQYKGVIHLHGHTHGRPDHGYVGVHNRYDVGIDMYGGPVELTPEAFEFPKGWS